MILLRYLMTILIFFCSCKSLTYHEQMAMTSKEILKAIQEGDENKFRKLIGEDLKQLNKTTAFLHSDFTIIKKFYDRYIHGKEVPIYISDSNNEMSQREVKIIFFNGNDSTYKVKKFGLSLIFGSPQIVPLNKIYNYKIILDADSSIIDVPNLPPPPDLDNPL